MVTSKYNIANFDGIQGKIHRFIHPFFKKKIDEMVVEKNKTIKQPQIGKTHDMKSLL